MKLGKQKPRHDPRHLLMASYLRAGSNPAPLPASVDWSAKDSVLGAMQNDKIGDCTCAAAGHLIQTWTANAESEVTIPDSDIVAAYAAVTGYDPTKPNTDNGAVEVDVLNYWRQTGIGGHKIDAYVALEPKNQLHVQMAVVLFGGIYIGLALPMSAASQEVWSVPPQGPIGNAAPGSWGGHAVAVVGYDAAGLTCITWGQRMRMTWGFWLAYTDEAYGVLSKDWIGSNGLSPSLFNLTQLEADLKEVTA